MTEAERQRGGDREGETKREGDRESKGEVRKRDTEREKVCVCGGEVGRD